jgi:hypothetical protein
MQTFLAYAPRGVGLRCALAYLATKRDVYGWFTGPRQDATLASLYFVIEDFYSQSARYVAAQSLDLHTGWILDQARCHELAALQEAFCAEWLWYRDDPPAAREERSYGEAELAPGEVNVRYARLEKFSTLQPTWSCYSPGFERPVLKYLSKRWPLEYRADDQAPI